LYLGTMMSEETGDVIDLQKVSLLVVNRQWMR